MAVHMKKLGMDRGYRQNTGEFLCDGIKLFYEAAACDMEITCVFTSDREFFENNKNVYLASRDILAWVSPLKTPQTVLFSCKTPQTRFPEKCGKIIVLENIQDPGNVGSIIRTASAFSIDGVILTGESADPYNPKTVRAAMGALFRQPVAIVPKTGLEGFISSRGLRLYGAALSEDAASPAEISFQNAAVAIGNEGSGLTDGLLALCTSKIKIPINPACESLNAGAAAAVIMWEMYKEHSRP